MPVVEALAYKLCVSDIKFGKLSTHCPSSDNVDIKDLNHSQ